MKYEEETLLGRYRSASERSRILPISYVGSGLLCDIGALAMGLISPVSDISPEFERLRPG